MKQAHETIVRAVPATRSVAQPSLALGLGYLEWITHDYTRHGATTRFAALNIATAEVLAQCKRRHRHQEFLAFLNHVEANVPATLDVHLILDNYGTHKHRNGEGLARAASALSAALHADLHHLAQPGRALV
jgi:hypothetical protein